MFFLCGDRFHPQSFLCPPAADCEATEVFLFFFSCDKVQSPGAQHPGTLKAIMGVSESLMPVSIWSK